MGNLFTEAIGNILTTLMGNVLTTVMGKVLDIYTYRYCSKWRDDRAQTNFMLILGLLEISLLMAIITVMVLQMLQFFDPPLVCGL